MIFRSAQLPFVAAQTQGTIPHQGCHLQPSDCQGALNTAKQQKKIPRVLKNPRTKPNLNREDLYDDAAPKVSFEPRLTKEGMRFSVWQSLSKALICIHRYKVDGVWNTSIFSPPHHHPKEQPYELTSMPSPCAQESNARMVNFLRGISPHFKSQPSRASSSSGSMWWRLKCVVKQHMLLTSRSKSPPNIPSTMLDKEVSIGNFRLMPPITPISKRYGSVAKMLWTQMWNINHISQPNNQINSSENQWLPKQSINEHNHFPRDRLGVPDGLMMTTVWGNVKVSSLMSSQPQECESVKQLKWSIVQICHETPRSERALLMLSCLPSKTKITDIYTKRTWSQCEFIHTYCALTLSSSAKLRFINVSSHSPISFSGSICGSLSWPPLVQCHEQRIETRHGAMETQWQTLQLLLFLLIDSKTGVPTTKPTTE